MAHPTSERVAANIRAELARRRISGREFATMLDRPFTTIARRLRGDQPFDVDELAGIARAIGCDVSALLVDTDLADEAAS